jgi:predicted ester cyclase
MCELVEHPYVHAPIVSHRCAARGQNARVRDELDAGAANDVVRRYVAILEGGAENAVEAFAAPDIVDHVSGQIGHAFWHVLARWVRESFADYRLDVRAVMHDGDRVMCWFTAHGRHVGNGFPQLAGVPVRGRDITWDQAHIFRVRDRLVVEH